MEDQAIVALYWQRSEAAISETDRKYGGYCYSIAYNILASREDAQESVSDTYFAAWEAMPPRRPKILSAFLAKLTRNTAIDRWRILTAGKRGGGQMTLALEELGDCVTSASAEERAISREAAAAFNRCLRALPQTERRVFLRRYFYLDPVAEIAESFGFTEAKVHSMLHRTRKKLKDQLEKEGYL